MPNVMNIRPVERGGGGGGEVISCGQTDGQMWRTAFRIFRKNPKTVESSCRSIFENVAHLLFFGEIS